MSGLKNLSNVDIAEFERFLNSFDTVLCDCDGVLLLLQTVIEGTPEVITKLDVLEKRVYYVTNNCVRTRGKFTQLLREGGFTLKEEDVIMPTIAIIDYLKSINFDKKLFVLSFNGLKQELMDAGFTLVDTGPSEVPEDTKAVMAAFSDIDPDVGAIVVDYDVNTNYLKLQKAVFYLKNPRVHFIAAAQDSIVTIGKNVRLIGPQHFQNTIKAMSGRDPMGFGKPSQNLIDFVNKKCNINPSRTLFIGDTFSDMIFADDAGYHKMLVLTGIVSGEDLKNCQDPKLLPDYYLNSLNDLNKLLDQIPNGVSSSL